MMRNHSANIYHWHSFNKENVFLCLGFPVWKWTVGCQLTGHVLVPDNEDRLTEFCSKGHRGSFRQGQYPDCNQAAR